MIVHPDLAAAVPAGTVAIVTPEPYLGLGARRRAVPSAAAGAPGIHPRAVVEPGAVVDPTAEIGPLAVIGAGREIGPGAGSAPAR